MELDDPQIDNQIHLININQNNQICSLLYHLGQVDDRAIEKYKREAKVKNRES